MTKYKQWRHYFEHNRWSLAEFAWSPDPGLTPSERDLLAQSLPHFQLGEGSEGRGLRRRAEQMAELHGETDLPAAMDAFIQEEQRHSAVLGRLLDQEGISRLSEHWVDGAFRRIRALAGFELMAAVLTSAECIAVPYYTALYEATANPLVRSIAQRILRDEAFHLEFQAENSELYAKRRGEWARLLTAAYQIGILSGAAALVYLLYRPLFAQAGMSPLRFWWLALSAYRPILERMARKQREGGRLALAWTK
jgi:hypothetical protein